MGGKFTLSDDCHGVGQVAICYGGALTYLESLGVTEVWTYERVPVFEDATTASDDHPPKMVMKEKAVPLTEICKLFP